MGTNPKEDLDLIDPYGKRNQIVKRYTWRQPLKQAGLDYFLVSHMIPI